MCTVSIVPRVDGFRLVCNRDELLSRPAALPPVRQSFGGVPVWHPVDPQGAGTWVAANGHGLVLALLNRQPAGSKRRTRGQIVLALAGAGGLAPVRDALRSVKAADYAAFRLVAVLGREVVIATSDGQHLALDAVSLNTPLLFTSSSLSDREAERRRRPLFEDLVLQSRDHLAGQQAFHDHRWPDCAEFSVRMRRADARTVSRTVVDVIAREVSLLYEPLPVEE